MPRRSFASRRGQGTTTDQEVLEARHVTDYMLWLRFRDGTAGEIDLGPRLHGEVFEPLRDLAQFRRFYVHPERRTLVWPGGADFAPEFLYAGARRTRRARLVSLRSTLARRLAAARARWMAILSGREGTMWAVPEISRFFGIVIHMYRADHAPPHFHASYGDYAMTMTIETGEGRGEFPPRALRIVREWTELHRDELLADWQLACEARPLRPILPLE